MKNTVTYNNSYQISKIGRDDYWDSAKGILICLVVIGHLLELTADCIPESLYVWTIIYLFHMPAFLLISGFFVKLSKRNPLRRIPKFVCLYVFVQYTSHILEFILGERSDWYGDLLSPTLGAWFLLFLVYANYISFFLKQSVKPNKIWMFVALVIGCVVGFVPYITNKGGLSRFFVFLLFFLAGYFEDWNSILKILRKKRTSLVIVSVIAIILFLIMQYEGVFQRQTLSGSISYLELYPGEEWKGLLFRFSLYFVSMLITMGFFSIVPQGNKILSSLGKNSLYIYIIHILIMFHLYDAFSEVITVESQIEKTLIVSGLTLLTLAVIIIVVIKCVAFLKTKYNRRMDGSSGE